MPSKIYPMNRIVVSLIIVFNLLLAAGVDASGILGALVLLYLTSGALRYMLSGKFPDHFLAGLIGIAVGPFFVCCLLQAAFGQLPISVGTGLDAIIPALIVLGLMIISFLYVRKQIRRLRPTEHEGHTNERRPLAPAHHDDDED